MPVSPPNLEPEGSERKESLTDYHDDDTIMTIVSRRVIAPIPLSSNPLSSKNEYFDGKIGVYVCEWEDSVRLRRRREKNMMRANRRQ
jgi:hypothetical protein